MTPDRPGTLLEAFPLIVDGREIDAQIRLVHAADGTEMLHHYEGNQLRLAHPARRCTDCTTILTTGSADGRCYTCADSHQQDTGEKAHTRAQISQAINRAADLIPERLDQAGDSLAWNVANIMVSTTDYLLDHPDATLPDVFVEHFNADPADPDAVMTEYGMD